MWTVDIFKTQSFKNDDVTIITWFTCRSFSQTQIQKDRWLLSFLNFSGKHLMRFRSKNSVFKLLRRSVNGKHIMHFQSKISVFKFLQRSVDGKHLMRFRSEMSVFNFLQRSVDEKHMMRFQSEGSVFKFPVCRSVNRKHLMRFQSKISFFKYLWTGLVESLSYITILQ